MSLINFLKGSKRRTVQQHYHSWKGLMGWGNNPRFHSKHGKGLNPFNRLGTDKSPVRNLRGKSGNIL